MAFLRFGSASTRTRWVMLIGITLAIATILLLGGRYRTLAADQPREGTLFIFFLINANILLLTVLIFLFARNVIKLVVESRRRVFGYRLRTKLVAIFVGFALVPTLLLFFVAKGFITDSIDYWFNLDVDRAVTDSLAISREYYSNLSGRARIMALRVSERLGWPAQGASLEDRLEALRQDYNLSLVEAFDARGVLLGKAFDGQSPEGATDPSGDLVRNALAGRGSDGVASADRGEFIKAAAPAAFPSGLGAVVVSIHLPEDIRARAEALSRTFRGYTEMRLQKGPIRANYMVYLLFLTMLILFSASWLGFFVARGITVPIGHLADGAERVAKGDLSVRVQPTSSDEIGSLVGAFNHMTAELERTKQDLENSSAENEKRRLYIETLLRNVGTGVVSLDADGRVNTFNRAAEAMFGVRAEEILGQPLNRVLRPEHFGLVGGMIEEVASGGRSVRREVSVVVRGVPMVLVVAVSVLEGADGKPAGAVLVVEDMTRLINAQRKAAWSEAAKRIAHEIKNPLTPIRLSAERLSRRLEDRLTGEERALLTECTGSIIREVNAMRGLVDEFSQFARLPTLRAEPGAINDAVREAASLYGAAETEVRVDLDLAPELPVIRFDREQMRRVIINLLDNAIRASREAGAHAVVVATRFEADEGSVLVTVADRGHGVPQEAQDRIFEPYFSTREGGTGLGLAIAQRIVEEHGGTLVYERNLPEGSLFTVRVPVDIDPGRRA